MGGHTTATSPHFSNRLLRPVPDSARDSKTYDVGVFESEIRIEKYRGSKKIKIFILQDFLKVIYVSPQAEEQFSSSSLQVQFSTSKFEPF